MIPVTAIQNGIKAHIKDFYKTPETAYYINKLYSVGFVKGSEIELLNKRGQLYILRAGNENPFCINKNVADIILVDDKYQTKTTEKNSLHAFLKKTNKLFEELLRKIKKH